MKRFAAVVIALALALALFAAVVAADGAAPPVPSTSSAAVSTVAWGAPGDAVPAKVTSKRCMYVLVGKNASADGSVLMGYNNDWSANNYAYLQAVPATATTHGYLRLMTLGKIREGGINDEQVAVCYGVATDRAPEVMAADPWVSKGVGQYMWDSILERFSTARQAIDWLERVAATTGFSAWAAGSFAVADAREAWVVELYGGHHWAAARLPDDCYYAQPNMLRLRRIDLSDRANYRGSPDLVTFAQKLGRYSPSDGPFDAAWAYGDRADLQSYYNTNRLWGITRLWSPRLAVDPTMPYARRPVFVRPERPLTRDDVMAFNREHYVNTQLDQTGGYTLMSPHEQTNRPVCCSYTDYGAVFQCRSQLPKGVGGILWMAPSRPCSSAFVPFYCGVTSVPADWTDHFAYEAFQGVAISLDKQGPTGSPVRYGQYIGLVRATYDAFVADSSTKQVALERDAARLWKTDRAAAVRLLTAYSAGRATTAVDLAKRLPAQMP